MRISVGMDVCGYAFILRACVHMSLCACEHGYTYVSVYLCLYVYVYVCLCVHMCIYYFDI